MMKWTKRVVWGLSSPIYYGFWVTSHQENPVAFNFTDLSQYIFTETGFIYLAVVFSGLLQNWATIQKSGFKKKKKTYLWKHKALVLSWGSDGRDLVHSCTNNWMDSHLNNGDGIKPDTLQPLQFPENRLISGWRWGMIWDGTVEKNLRCKKENPFSLKVLCSDHIKPRSAHQMYLTFNIVI